MARFRQLRELRRQQRGAYTPEELARRREILLEKSVKRHEKYALEAKAHEEMLARGTPALIPIGLLPKYKPRYRSVFRQVYRPNLAPREFVRVKYRCGSCGFGALWQQDYLNHIREEHPDKQTTRLGRIK